MQPVRFKPMLQLNLHCQVSYSGVLVLSGERFWLDCCLDMCFHFCTMQEWEGEKGGNRVKGV